MSISEIKPTRRGFLAGALSAVAVVSLSACGGLQGGTGGSKATGSAAAVNYPTKALEYTLPSSPGGSTDLIGRAVAKSMEAPFGQPIAIVNKPGANGAVGGKEVLGSAPDGYKMVMLFKSLMAITPLAVEDANPISMDNMTIISGLTVEDYVMVVNTEAHPDGDLKALLSKPGLSYGTAGVGTGGQLAQALLLKSSGVDYKDVPFAGGAPAVTALLGKQVDAITVQLAEAMPHVKSGKFRTLCVFGDKRSEFLDDIPTAKESGYDVVVDQRRFNVVPKDVNADVAKILTEAHKKAFEDSAYGDFLKNNFISRWEVDADEVRSHIAEAAKTFEEMVKKHDISLKG